MREVAHHLIIATIVSALVIMLADRALDVLHSDSAMPGVQECKITAKLTKQVIEAACPPLGMRGGFDRTGIDLVDEPNMSSE